MARTSESSRSPGPAPAANGPHASARAPDRAGVRGLAFAAQVQRLTPRGGAARAVQRYQGYPAAGQPDATGAHDWQSNGAPLRVTEDGNAAVEEVSAKGSDKLYVAPGRVAAMNGTLAANRVPIAFEPGGDTVQGRAPVGGAARVLTRVTPVDRSLGPALPCRIPDDCGRAAHVVTGADAEGKALEPDYKDGGGAPAHASSTVPDVAKAEIIVSHFGQRLPEATRMLREIDDAVWRIVAAGQRLAPYQAQTGAITRASHAAAEALRKARAAGDAAGEATALAQYEAAKKQWDALMATRAYDGKTVAELMKERAQAETDKIAKVDAVFAPYLALSEAQRDAVDQRAGINRYADPQVGEAYVVSSGGPAKPGKMTWNYHWAGVILKTGADNVTMEGYAGHVGQIFYQVYGVPTADDARTGQTFHEQARDTHGEHGERPTTMVASKRER